MTKTVSLLGILTLCIASGVLHAAPSADEKAAQQAVLKVLKDPSGVKFGTFTVAGAQGACLTVFRKNWQTLGTQEAFLQRKDNAWEALYVADVPTGHEGCVAEMSKR